MDFWKKNKASNGVGGQSNENLFKLSDRILEDFPLPTPLNDGLH